MQARTSFNKCGETSTYDNTYTGVVHRHLSQIPRLSDHDVHEILGPKAAIAAAGAEKVKERHLQEVQSGGNPAFWSEYKPVECWKGLFRDTAATEVFDFTPGSGAAAAAALHCGIVNLGHKQWLDGVLDKTIYAVAADSPESAAAVGASAECVANIKLFFQGTVKEAKRYLIAAKDDSPGAEVEEDEQDEEDDGDESDDS